VRSSSREVITARGPVLARSSVRREGFMFGWGKGWELGPGLVVVYSAQASDNCLLLHGVALRVPNDYFFLGPVS
jgi:hypothetical protein